MNVLIFRTILTFLIVLSIILNIYILQLVYEFHPETSEHISHTYEEISKIIEDEDEKIGDNNASNDRRL